MDNLIEHLKIEIKNTQELYTSAASGALDDDLLAQCRGKIFGLKHALMLAELALENNLIKADKSHA
jgi:hypothetical protein